ncbi:hypothetical protein [Paraburkholderia lacunae]|uniref:hypothetical protein n=1 Tax=Paraburkholderia lacunae TaxID=2211104 RepID=UPI0014024D13|nr:hypothetical protein [Paraburkholderia lacunae]
MPSPTGSVPALSSAAATIFSIGIVFLGYCPHPYRATSVSGRRGGDMARGGGIGRRVTRGAPQ